MRTQRQKQLLEQYRRRWLKWRRDSRKEALDVLRLLHLKNQISSASGPVVTEPRESLEAL